MGSGQLARRLLVQLPVRLSGNAQFVEVLDLAKVALAVVSNALEQRAIVKMLGFSKVVFAIVRNMSGQSATGSGKFVAAEHFRKIEAPCL